MVIFSMTFQFFVLGELSAITYSVPEGINYSLELIVCVSYSELLDAMLGSDRARGHMAFLFSSFFPLLCFICQAPGVSAPSRRFGGRCSVGTLHVITADFPAPRSFVRGKRSQQKTNRFLV